MVRRGIAHLKKSDPVLKTVIEGIKLRELSRHGGPEAYFESLVEAIVSQQLSVKAADTIFKRFAALTLEKQFPTPRQVLNLSTHKMRRAGLSRMKVSFIKDLAKKVLDKTVNLKEIDRWPDEKVMEHLTAVKGIGPWTAEMFLIFSLGRDDIFSYGDLGLRNAMQKLYKMKKAPTRAQAEKIVTKWKPYRSLASRYLWASIDNRPKTNK